MKDRFTKADLKGVASDILAQCREEYPAEVYDEVVSDMCEAVICAEGFSRWEAELLREFCGL